MPVIITSTTVTFTTDSGMICSQYPAGSIEATLRMEIEAASEACSKAADKVFATHDGWADMPLEQMTESGRHARYHYEGCYARFIQAHKAQQAYLHSQSQG